MLVKYLEVDVVFLHVSFTDSIKGNVTHVVDLDLNLALRGAERATLDVDPERKSLLVTIEQGCS